MGKLKQNAKTAKFISSSHMEFEYQQKSNPQTSNLDMLSYGTYRIVPGCISDQMYHHSEEAILFSVEGETQINVDGKTYKMEHYDTLYIPMATPYTLKNCESEEALLIVCKAKASKKYKTFHSSWQEFSKDENRIRHLDGKDVFLMFDVTENADKLVAGYTIFESFTRAYPAHNHIDQEEIYIFIEGSGAMEVYADEKSKTFVTSVDRMDAVSIPILNYHPVFSQQKPLTFIWCIAGERYWVGDKDKNFMKGDVDKLTT